jgi:hypothetical protein
MRNLKGILGALGLLLAGCPSDNGSSSPPPSYEKPATYFTTMTSLVVEVAYEDGAAPYTGSGLPGQMLWDFSRKNLEFLFQGRATVPQISVPGALADMKLLPAQHKPSWTVADILGLAGAQRTGTCTATTGDFFVVFLNGYFDDGSGPDPNVLAVQITGTSVLALFKQALTGATIGDPSYVGRYMEQSTLVHEMGHALGLVNDGLPMVVNHQDTAHGNHCTNSACVMFWMNEGATAASQFVKNYIMTGNENVFGSECLNDARLYAP